MSLEKYTFFPVKIYLKWWKSICAVCEASVYLLTEKGSGLVVMSITYIEKLPSVLSIYNMVEKDRLMIVRAI